MQLKWQYKINGKYEIQCYLILMKSNMNVGDTGTKMKVMNVILNGNNNRRLRSLELYF